MIIGERVCSMLHFNLQHAEGCTLLACQHVPPIWVQKVPAGEDLAKQLRSASAEDEGQQGQPNMVFL